MGLQTIESNADAMYGFDARDHAQVLVQIQKAQVTPRDWLLVESLLSRHTMTIHVQVARGTMVQGLSTSSPLYMLLQRMLQEEEGRRTIGATIMVHPRLLQIHNEVATHTQEADYIPWKQNVSD